MDDALLVRRFERVGNLPRDWERLVEGIGATGDPLRESSPSTSSMTSAVALPYSSESVDGCDVWVVQRREDFRFALKTREPVAVRRRVRLAEF